LFLEGAEDPDEGFANSSGADHMNDLFLCHCPHLGFDGSDSNPSDYNDQPSTLG
jgi:hypothetical protein